MADSGYTFLDDVAIADVALRAWAPTLEGLFEAAARATAEVMVADTAAIQPLERRDVAAREREPDMLLFDLLDEQIYYKDSASLILLCEAIRVERDANEWTVNAKLAGEPIDPQRHALNADVKAVTMHRFSVYQKRNYWYADVVLDI